MTPAQDVASLANRRLILNKLHPSCPKCAEKEQVQLVEWVGSIPKWKCRVCKTSFATEATL